MLISDSMNSTQAVVKKEMEEENKTHDVEVLIKQER
jgi:hypothetical protein